MAICHEKHYNHEAGLPKQHLSPLLYDESQKRRQGHILYRQETKNLKNALFSPASQSSSSKSALFFQWAAN